MTVRHKPVSPKKDKYGDNHVPKRNLPLDKGIFQIFMGFSWEVRLRRLLSPHISKVLHRLNLNHDRICLWIINTKIASVFRSDVNRHRNLLDLNISKGGSPSKATLPTYFKSLTPAKFKPWPLNHQYEGRFYSDLMSTETPLSQLQVYSTSRWRTCQSLTASQQLFSLNTFNGNSILNAPMATQCGDRYEWRPPF